ncbi:branched-chain amino acid aminotransferase [candidate division TA06 bacterium DG_26]|uniref:Branched-chain-amino-acid aminotransferase n=1 Tax=candidate division TA06 bacterium DG_26 TaxID=1703771 RepID=A0A0S7WDZ5_UNCT6|nr:MAG: branched-chain amino acid aminotransferase [candidate division TA06 bacterium DG_26]
MPLKKSKFIWMDGQFVRWDEARIHILSHVVHYGTSVFEGLRCYKTKNGPAILRLKEHTDRLFNSAKIYRMEIPYAKDRINQAVIDTIRKNEHNECYIRPIVYRGYSELGVNPFNCPVGVTVATWEWGKYLGEDAIEQGVEVMVSTWNRMAPNTFPAIAKAGANYMNSALIKMEALVHGYTEGIALDVFGYVSEGSGENLFLVKDEVLYTPQIGASILPGITRDSVIAIARDLGYKLKEQFVPREFLYIADEAFLTGSAAEITPIRMIDKIPVGSGTRGPVTKRIQEQFFLVTQGEDKYQWLTYL